MSDRERGGEMVEESTYRRRFSESERERAPFPGGGKPASFYIEPRIPILLDPDLAHALVEHLSIHQPENPALRAMMFQLRNLIQ